MRFVKANFPEDKLGAVKDIIEQAKPIDWAMDEGYGKFEKAVEIVVDKGKGQELIDNLQELLEDEDDWRIVVLPIEATMPQADRGEDTQSAEDKKNKKIITLREELYQKVEGDCRLNADFLILTVLSAIVAAIGLNQDNVAIVIAAMVIAPLLGPILAFALASALGNLSLMIKASKTAMAGLATGFLFAVGLSQFMTVDLESTELMSRTVINPAIIALALASGAAAALSLSTGISSALVGVMVAVALLPPAVASALFLGAGEFHYAAAAAILLVLNVICALLSAQLVFVYKGVRPRNWQNQKKAATSVIINAAVWITLLAGFAFLAYKLNLQQAL